MEFTTLSDLLVPGHHDMVWQHLGLHEEFPLKMQSIIEELTVEVNQLLDNCYQTGDQGDLCECNLLKMIYRLIDEQAQPHTTAELVFAVHTASSIISYLQPFVERALSNDRAVAQSSQQSKRNDARHGSFFNPNNTATA